MVKNRINKVGMLFALFIVLNLPVFSQGISSFDSLIYKNTEARAHKKFHNLAYARAIEMFENLLNKGYYTDSLVRNLAISYYKIANTVKSEDMFRNLIDSNRYTATDLYFYVQSLKYNKKYAEADIWMEKYSKMDSLDSRVGMQKASAEFVRNLMALERYKIHLLPFNSENADFGAIEYDGRILFSSSRRDQAIIRFQDAWKQSPYLAMYFVNSDSASVINAKIFTRKFNTIYNDGPACMDTSGTEIFITRNNYRYRIPRKDKEGVNNLKILFSKKTGIGTWSVPEELPFNSNDYSCGHPSLSLDGKTLYFTSNMPGGFGGTDIYFVSRTDSGWTKPVNLGKDINTEGDEMFPFVQTGSLLYFASNGHQGLGGLDLFVAKKGKNGYSVKNMGVPINSSSDDFGLYLRNPKYGYFASNRPGGKGDDDIYSVNITHPISFDLILKGSVIDSASGEKLDNLTVDFSSNDGLLEHTSTDQTNEFQYSVDANENYTFFISKNGYMSCTIVAKPSELSISNDTGYLPVKLSPKIEYGIYGNVYLKGTSEIIPEINVKVFDGSKNITNEITTSGKEPFKIQLAPENDYQIMFTKAAFLTKRAYYSTKGRAPGYVNINEFIDVEVQKLELGATVEIPNIYYDLAKWNIRPDAAVELDKVFQFLNDNPTIRVELGSHTDSRGSDISNLNLSQKRAQSAVDYIVQKGIDAKRITARGYGESKLKNKCVNGIKCTEEEHQQNRRTEIIVTGF